MATQETNQKDAYKLYYDGRLAATLTDRNLAINGCKTLYNSELEKGKLRRCKITLMQGDTDITDQAIESDFIAR